MVDQIANVAVAAYDARVPAKIGVGWAVDWDPFDEVYRDRRGENDALAPWGDDGPQGLGKDPHLGVIRFDTVDDEPIAILANFGMHGTLGGEDNPLVSGDSGGHLEVGLEESFGDQHVVAMFAQGSGGDVSPAGREDGYAKMETIGVLGAPKIRALYDAVETSDAPIRMETVSRAIYKDPSRIHVTRNGTVDWNYAPYDDSPGFVPDNVVYADDGSILSPIDEFNTESGAVFCGSGDLDFPIGGLTATVFPYENCMQVSLLASLIEVFFDLDEMKLPTPESLKAGTTTSRMGPFPTRRTDGTEVDEDLFVGFFPGEPVYSYGEQWRRRVKDELGIDDAMMVGYSQDHEGYLLIPEDWLVGGYEPDIGIWGPLEAEHVMEGVLAYSKELLLTTDVREDPDPLGQFGPTVYPDEPLPTAPPDPTPDAGERITTAKPYLWTAFIDIDDPDAPKSPSAAELTVPAQVPRVQGIVQIAWEGGDPAVDAPKVVLERQDGAGWTPVVTAAGRQVDEGRHDILLGHTPTPLYPADAVQTHQWWAAWQAVSHWDDRAGLPLGTYRLHVSGNRYGGQAEHWPWDGVPYEVTSEPFEVVPAVISVNVDPYGIRASLHAPEHGYRLIDIDGSESGDNPLTGQVTVEITSPAGTDTQLVSPALEANGSRLPVAIPADWTEVRVTDGYGNTGTATP